MLQLSLTTLFKFLMGVFLAQGITVLLAILAMRSEDRHTWMLLALLGSIVGLLVSLMLAAIASHGRGQALARAQENFARERERIRVRAEKDKAKVLERSQKQAMKQTGRAQAQANFKVRAAFAGMIGIGALMLFTQFITLGLVLLTTGGGALAGYLFRARQEYLGRKEGKKSPPLGNNRLKRLLGPGPPDAASHPPPIPRTPPRRGPWN